MENETLQQNAALIAERLAAAAVQLEQAIAGMEERHAHVCGDVQRIVATAEGAFGDQRDASRLELERKLSVAEHTIASLQSQVDAHAAAPVRKTVAGQMFSKAGLDSASSLEAGALDAALSGLSLEQRIAVKSQLAKAGLLG